eukprot:6723707-Alexandrium_andersonii.AAC.1
MQLGGRRHPLDNPSFGACERGWPLPASGLEKSTPARALAEAPCKALRRSAGNPFPRKQTSR